MATFKNESDQTFVFPTLGIIVEPGDVFDADSDITTAGIVAASGGKKKADVPVVDPAPVAVTVAPETPAEEGK